MLTNEQPSQIPADASFLDDLVEELTSSFSATEDLISQDPAWTADQEHDGEEQAR